MTLPITLISPKSWTFLKVRAMPRSAMSGGLSPAVGRPSKVMVPSVGS